MDFRIIDITKDLVTTTPYPGDPAPELTVFSAIANGDACNMARLTTTLHAGTHADAPLHFLQGGAAINAVVLSATLIYELTGPVITKLALTKAGEIPAATK